MPQPITILAIESSCDETAAAIIRDGKLLSSVVSSQIPLHQRFGGVVPEIAARAHVEQLLPVVEQALTQAFGKGDPRELIDQNIDAFAVTSGPGLVGSLLIGVSAARTLSLSFNKPLIPVHHIMGHAYSNFLKSDMVTYPFPFLTLVASGGHTELIFSKSHADHKIISQTRDDAAGEAFDKAASILGLGYPGGPSIAKAALHGDLKRYVLPQGLRKEQTNDFSFSGVKTALLKLKNELVGQGLKLTDIQSDLAASFQHSVVTSLVTKTIQAAEQLSVEHIFLSGGVAANTALRESFEAAAKHHGLIFSVPEIQYCTDNAAMIAAAAYAVTQLGPISTTSFPWYDVDVQRQPALRLEIN